MWLSHSMCVRDKQLVYLHTFNITYTIYRTIYKSIYIYIYTYTIIYTTIQYNTYKLVRILTKYNAFNIEKNTQHIAIHYYIITVILHYSSNNIYYIT